MSKSKHCETSSNQRSHIWRKSKSWRSAKYLEFVRSRESVVSGSSVDIVAHHVRCLGGGGTGLKPPDWMCVPLTAHEHTILHQTGEARYWRERGIDPAAMISMTMLVYLAQNPGIDLIERLADAIEK